MKNKVLIFTNIDSWEVFDQTLIQTPLCNFTSNYPNEAKPIALCIFNSENEVSLESVDNCENGGVYLVFDNITQGKFKELVESTNDCPSYFLLHNRIIGNEHPPYNKSDISPAEKRIVRTGSHIDIIYKSIFKILADDEDKKMERIIRVFWPKLETVVRFLNECLTPKSELFEEYEKKILDDFNGICFSVNSVEYPVNESVKEFCKKYRNANELGAYESELINLRDILINAATK